MIGGPWPLYGALDRETVWAEWARSTGGAVRPEDDPRALCTFEADLRVLDLREAAVREALGMTLAALRADWSDRAPNAACLRVARQAAERGADGFIVPSAARDDGWCLDVLPAAFAKVRQVSRRAVTPAPPA
ncbi:MAG: RES family NAD+ phosphorylase [Chloroflexi bacterium]|nr:RES family NAD+ phosphorylase [Chloroflexota bacterium]